MLSEEERYAAEMREKKWHAALSSHLEKIVSFKSHCPCSWQRPCPSQLVGIVFRVARSQ